MALTTGVGLAATHGILIRSGDALQAAKKIDTIVLDKTGTITVGKPAVTDIIPAAGFAAETILVAAAAAERDSEHPLAAAIVEGAGERGLPVDAPTQFEAVPGHGIRAHVAGSRVLVGNRAFLEVAGAKAAPRLTPSACGRRQDARVRGDRWRGVIATPIR
jgi:Cu+-exporting ATPase